jgi:DNA-binding IclR family transcriptional regulator
MLTKVIDSCPRHSRLHALSVLARLSGDQTPMVDVELVVAETGLERSRALAAISELVRSGAIRRVDDRRVSL